MTSSQSRRSMLQHLALASLGFALGCVRPRSLSSEPKGDSVNGQAKPTKLQGVDQVVTVSERHWVGDGFFVSTVFSPHRINPQTLSPFILMDYGAPRHFPSTTKRRGVGEHPHRGFETVTFAYQGEVDHRDCLLYTSPSPRDRTRSRMPSSA